MKEAFRSFLGGRAIDADEVDEALQAVSRSSALPGLGGRVALNTDAVTQSAAVGAELCELRDGAAFLALLRLGAAEAQAALDFVGSAMRPSAERTYTLRTLKLFVSECRAAGELDHEVGLPDAEELRTTVKLTRPLLTRIRVLAAHRGASPSAALRSVVEHGLPELEAEFAAPAASTATAKEVRHAQGR